MSAFVIRRAGVTALVPPMLLAMAKALPVGPEWVYEIKFDRFRDQAKPKALTKEVRLNLVS